MKCKSPAVGTEVGTFVLMEFIDEEEEMALLKKQLLMSRSNGVMDSFNKGLGEVRKVNIVYYLCLNGKVDQPHLIRIHVYNNGVRLRDVKRWLSELRGKDMPDSFAWSYKRKYKSGYVWQDLMDGDLITPICDNEYILMGSKVPSSFHFSPIDTFSCGLMSPLGEIDLGMVAKEERQMAPPKSKPSTRQISFELEEDVPPKSPQQVEKSSPESHHDQQNKHDVNFKIEIRSDQEEEQHEEKQEPYWPEESPQEGKRKKGKQKRRALRDIIDGPTDDVNTSPLLLLPDQPQRERRKAFNWSLCIRTSSVKYP